MFRPTLLIMSALLMALMGTSCGREIQGGAVTPFEMPENIGAYRMPYVRYASQTADFRGVHKTAHDFDFRKTASEASGQEFVSLRDTDDFISWTVNTLANGVVVRFTLPDGLDERLESVGNRSNMDIFVNDEKVKTVTLDSRWSWQYFRKGVSEPFANVYADDLYPMMRFDEARFMLADFIQPGDVVKIRKSDNDGLELGIDFIEIEAVPAPITKPANALSVKDFGAKGDGIADDYEAFIRTINAANEQGKIVFIPEGTFRLHTMLRLHHDGTNLQGAGMWYTHIFFSNDEFRQGGFLGNANRLRIADMHITGENDRRLGIRDIDGNFVYVINLGWEGRVLYQDQKGISGNFGDSSVIENVWIEHFECGIWIAPYAWVEGKEEMFRTPEGFTWTNDQGVVFDVPAGLLLDVHAHAPAESPRTRYLRVTNTRLRNNYADGVNFAEGTSFSIFEHSSVRNNGDDGIASWSQTDAGPLTPPNRGNIFRYNTIELGWRAGAIGMFGGGGHQIYNSIIGEHMLSAGLRFTADFPGHPMCTDPDNRMVVRNIIIDRAGSTYDLFGLRLGAIEIRGSERFSIQNMLFENIIIKNSQTDGIHLWDGGENVQNVTFRNIKIEGVGKGFQIGDEPTTFYHINAHSGAGSANFENVTSYRVRNEGWRLNFR